MISNKKNAFSRILLPGPWLNAFSNPRFVDLIGAFGRESSLSLQVRYAKIIREAAHNISKTTGGSSTTGGMYTCLQLKSSGIMEDSATSIAGEIEAYLRHRNIQGTDDHQRSVKEMNAICRNRSCHISSDYTHLNCQMGLSEGDKSLQVSVIESLLCGHASGVFTTFNSSPASSAP
jgi:hypothetical protein